MDVLTPILKSSISCSQVLTFRTGDLDYCFQRNPHLPLLDDQDGNLIPQIKMARDALSITIPVMETPHLVRMAGDSAVSAELLMYQVAAMDQEAFYYSIRPWVNLYDPPGSWAERQEWDISIPISKEIRRTFIAFRPKPYIIGSKGAFRLDWMHSCVSKFTKVTCDIRNDEYFNYYDVDFDVENEGAQVAYRRFLDSVKFEGDNKLFNGDNLRHYNRTHYMKQLQWITFGWDVSELYKTMCIHDKNNVNYRIKMTVAKGGVKTNPVTNKPYTPDEMVLMVVHLCDFGLVAVNMTGEQGVYSPWTWNVYTEFPDSRTSIAAETLANGYMLDSPSARVAGQTTNNAIQNQYDG